MMQKFWDSTMALDPADNDDDTRSDSSWKASEAAEAARSHIHLSSVSDTFSFKIQDKKGRMHRFHCETKSLADLIASIIQRVGSDIDNDNIPQILYEDEEHDKVILASDGDLAAAVEHARSLGWKGLRLHLEYSGIEGRRRASGSASLDHAHVDAWRSAYSTVAAGAALAAGLGVLAYLKRAGN